MTQLVKYDAMCRAIDVAFEFDEVKDIRDKAAMLEAAAKVAGNTQAEDRCYEIRRRAEAKAAKLYDAQEKAKGALKRGQELPRSDERTSGATLADLGTTKQDMAEWRKLASVPQKQFDAAFAHGGKPSVAEITGKKKVERSPESASALWVWGRIMEFERNGTLKTEPTACLKEWEEHQIDDILRLGPEIADWLWSLITIVDGLRQLRHTAPVDSFCMTMHRLIREALRSMSNDDERSQLLAELGAMFDDLRAKARP